MPYLVQRRDPATLAESWTAEVPARVEALAALDDVAIVAVRDGTIHVLSAGDGNIIGDLGADGLGVASGAMIAEPGWIYAVHSDGMSARVARHPLP